MYIHDRSVRNGIPLIGRLQYKGDCSLKSGADGSAFGVDYVDHLARSFETQTWIYEQASGWIMWTWKTEQAADWSMVTGITYGAPLFALLGPS